MATSELDQVIWVAANVTTGGTPAAYAYSDVLPAATTAADLATRATLRRAGAIRRVVVATTAEDFASEATAAATATAAAEATATGTTAGDPVLLIPGGLPIVADITPG